MRKKKQEEEAARLRAERLARRKEISDAASELQSGAAELAKWVKANKDKFASAATAASNPSAAAKHLGGTTAETEAKLRELRDGFRGEEKPPKAAEKARLSEVHTQLKARLMADAMAEDGAADPDSAAATADAEKKMAAGSPEELQKEWSAMEGAEVDYEAALLARRKALEAEARAAETDKMLTPMIKSAEELLQWVDREAKRLQATAGEAPNMDGAKAAETREGLKTWNEMDKPPKEEAKVGVQRALREIGQRRANEGRDPPPALDSDLEKAWNGLEAAASALEGALETREKSLAKLAAQAETDQQAAANGEKANTWLASVRAQEKEFKDRVGSKNLGGSAAETEGLLSALRDGYQKQRKPQLAAEKTSIEDGRRGVDARRAAEGRGPAEWNPKAEALNSAWSGAGEAEREYEQALLARMGALQEGEEEKLKRAGQRQKALDDLSGLLPPFIARHRLVLDAASDGSAAAERARAAGRWADARREAHEEEMRTLDNENVRERLAELDAASKGEKKARFEDIEDAVSKAGVADAARQLQRAGVSDPTEADAEAAAAGANSWAEMEASEATLRAELVRRVERLDGAALEWERLQRGCKAVRGWLDNHRTAIESVEVGKEEEDASRLLHEATHIQSDLGLQSGFVARLEPLAKRLAADKEYGERADVAFAAVSSVPSLREPMASRVQRLTSECERLKRLGAERRAFARDTTAFAATLAHAQELAGFPVDTVDTAETLQEVRQKGGALATKLLPAPEGALTDPEAVRRAEELVQAWQEVSLALEERSGVCEAAHRARLHAEKLFGEYKAATDAFDEWHARVAKLLDMPRKQARVPPPSASASASHARASPAPRAPRAVALSTQPRAPEPHRARSRASRRSAAPRWSTRRSSRARLTSARRMSAVARWRRTASRRRIRRRSPSARSMRAWPRCAPRRPA